MSNRMSTASNLKAEGLRFSKKSDRAAIDKTAETATTDFVSDDLKFIEDVLEEVLRHAGLSSDIIKGLAAFDPYIKKDLQRWLCDTLTCCIRPSNYVFGLQCQTNMQEHSSRASTSSEYTNMCLIFSSCALCVSPPSVPSILPLRWEKILAASIPGCRM